ncbi:MAG: deoxyribodipyrimidine photo-lyase [Bacteroidales bacterium]|nr:deoxyribodipyrimidine photo-lyase [Bacteroidales bacterium]
MEVEEQNNTEIVIHWFRRDLRLEDNTSLYKALESGFKVLPVFIFDTAILSSLEKDDRRIGFICGVIEQLQSRLAESGSAIELLIGKPLEVFEQLASRFRIHAVFTNHDYEPYALERDAVVSEYLNKLGIGFQSFKDQVIFEKSEILNNSGNPYTVFTPYSNKWKQALNMQSVVSKTISKEKLSAALLQFKKTKAVMASDLGFENCNELQLPVIDEKKIAEYHHTRDLPALDATTRLSVHLRFGTVSIRSLVSMARRLNEVWLNELIWREFFMQILWHFPNVQHNAFKPAYDRINWLNQEADFRKWCEGETGFPIVDAGMRELRETGFMHNRVRMITASFLVKHLLIDWRWGEAWFARHLLDFELSSNNGNWQWASGSGCDAAPYFRIFNPVSQAEKFDPKAEYIRRWIPEFGSSKYCKPMIELSMSRDRCLKAYAVVRNK